MPNMEPCRHCGKQHALELRFCPDTGRIIAPERVFPQGKLLEGKYRVGRLLGVGGMGAVFEATHTLLEKRVAIKFLLPELARDREMSARLMREARAASATGHPNIAGVTDMGYTDDAALFMVMEYVAGPTLEEVIAREGALPVDRACGLIDQVLAALEVVHRRGIVHRDLKPGNVVVTTDDEGREVVKILDFGISKMSDDPVLGDLTTTGLVMGTPRYMAPEQATGEVDLDCRADIYAAGAILYEMVTGQPSLTAGTYNALIAALVQGRIAPPRSVNPALSRQLSDTVMKALARRPEERHPDAGAFRRALAQGREREVSQSTRGTGAPTAGPSEVAFGPIELAPAGALLQGGGGPAALADPGAAPGGEARSRSAAGGAGAGADEPAPAAASAPADHSFEPPPDDVEALELEQGGAAGQWARLELAAPPPVGAPPPPRRPRAVPVRGRRAVRWAVTLALVAVLGGAAWSMRGHLAALSQTGADDGAVMLLIETVPRQADIYVDGVLTVSRPIQLPRSTREFRVRVQAAGYRSKVVRVSADRTRSVRVELAPR